ncbi:hypothetical protein HPG69_009512 [Diceros bicornis minor]|uniref:Uncharacterized protein n=1 Tax=Diceros bicornis minor TaxID=77932 RepID=A0A7J7F3D7_DICBM|nr:hypothetical protein HPG69_009512 [Diceros bicornis minor]
MAIASASPKWDPDTRDGAIWDDDSETDYEEEEKPLKRIEARPFCRQRMEMDEPSEEHPEITSGGFPDTTASTMDNWMKTYSGTQGDQKDACPRAKDLPPASIKQTSPVYRPALHCGPLSSTQLCSGPAPQNGKWVKGSKMSLANCKDIPDLA